MPAVDAEGQLSGLRLNLRIVSIINNLGFAH